LVAGPVHEPPEYLAEKLSETGRLSFGKLCNVMCASSGSAVSHGSPCQTLAYFFALLSNSEVELNNGTRLDLRSLDSYDSALGEFTVQDLEDIASKARELIWNINELKKTPLVRELDRRSLIPPNDVLARADFPCDTHFQGLLNLRNTATLILGDPRKPKRPGFDSDLTRVYAWIHQHTGRWYDEQVADLLNDLFPEKTQGDQPFTQSSLKQWRYYRGLTATET
jgi:hypothetical protein